MQNRCPELDRIEFQKPELCDVVNEGNNMTAFERIFAANVQAQQFTRQFLKFLQKYIFLQIYFMIVRKIVANDC